MPSCAGNLVVTSKGLRLVQELEPRDYVLGLGRGRDMSFGQVKASVASDATSAFLILSSSGESILGSRDVLSAIGGRRSVGDYFRDEHKQDVRIERLPLIGRLKGADCSLSGCVARMYVLLRVNHETQEVRFRNIRALSKETRQELEIRNGSMRAYEYYMRARYDSWTSEALFHDGECRGYELLFSFSKDRLIPVQYSAARQAYQFYRRAGQEMPVITASYGYAPLTVSLGPENPRKIDRIEGIRFVGHKPAFKLTFDDGQFSPIVGTIPCP